MLHFNKKRLIRLWQFAVVAACFATIILLFMYSIQLNKVNHNILYSQTDSLSRVILRQAANVAASSIHDKNEKKLSELVSNLQKEPLILDASVYGLSGTLLASSKDAMPLDQLTGLNTPLAVASIGRRQLVEPLSYDNQLVGFIRITLEHGEITKETSNRLEQNINLIRSMLMVALLTGALLIFTIANRLELWLHSFRFKPH